MKIWSVIYPVLLYYVGCSIGSLFFSVGVPMLVGACVIFPIFQKEMVLLEEKRKKRTKWKRDLPLLIIFGAVSALFFNILFAWLGLACFFILAGGPKKERLIAEGLGIILFRF